MGAVMCEVCQRKPSIGEVSYLGSTRKMCFPCFRRHLTMFPFEVKPIKQDLYALHREQLERLGIEQKES